MRKLSFLFLVIVLLASGVAQAQKKYRIPPTPVRTPQLVIIQDDAGEGFMVFDIVTGAYKCKLCEYDYYYTGTGSVKLDGCLAIFSAITDEYTMTAYADICEQKAKCTIEVSTGKGFDLEPYVETLSDSNLRDSEATCGVSEPPPVTVPNEIVLQNDADGSFLLLVPAGGEFKFIHCEDNAGLGGFGKVTMSGAWLNFEVIATEYRILASVNLETKAAKAVIDVFAPVGEFAAPMQEVISDSNFADNVPACGAKKYPARTCLSSPGAAEAVHRPPCASLLPLA